MIIETLLYVLQLGYSGDVAKEEMVQKVIVSPTPTVTKEDPRVSKLNAYFKKFNSPLVGLEEVFINEADKNNLDWKLLPTIACVESSCGKKYHNNIFGWGSDKLDYGSNSEDITVVASKIASLSYYKNYRQTRQLQDFGYAYNRPYYQEYNKKLEWFYNQI